MPLVTRDITQGRQDQGNGETVEYTLTTTNWGSSPSNSSVSVFDMSDDETDVTATVASGSSSESGDVITFQAISSLTAGRIYRADVTFTTGNDTLVVPVFIHCNAFSYIGDLSTDRDKVRLYLSDTDPSQGPLPEGRNFADTEIDGLVTTEGKWQRAVAGGFEILSNAWAIFPSFDADGLRLDRSDIADRYQKLAETQRKRFGYSGTTAGVRTITRVDGYSDDVSIDEV